MADETALGGASFTESTETTGTTVEETTGAPVEGVTEGKMAVEGKTDTTAAEKTADETTAESKDTKGDEEDGDAKAGAPEAYEEFAVPEGAVIDEAMMGKFTDGVKYLNLNQEQAQGLLDLYAEQNEAVQAAQVEAQEQQWTDIQTGWQETAKADKEIGGVDHDEKIAIARSALQRFGTPELVQAMNELRFGDHPELIRTFFRVGQHLTESKIASGDVTPPSKSPAEIMYPGHYQDAG